MRVTPGPGLCADSFVFFWEQRSGHYVDTVVAGMGRMSLARLYFFQFLLFWTFVKYSHVFVKLDIKLHCHKSIFKCTVSKCLPKISVTSLLQGEYLHVVCELFGVKRTKNLSFVTSENQYEIFVFITSIISVNTGRSLFFIFTLHQLQTIPCDWGRTLCHPSSPFLPQRIKVLFKPLQGSFSFSVFSVQYGKQCHNCLIE